MWIEKIFKKLYNRINSLERKIYYMASHRKNIKETERLTKEFRKLARRADDRLRALEKLSNKSGFENVDKFAYRSAMRDIKKWSGEGKTTFNRDVPQNLNQLKAKLNDVKNFLNSKTSTKTGIIKEYQDRADRINKFTGGKTSYTWEDLANVFENAQENKWYESGAKSYLIAVDYMKNHEEELINAIEENNKAIIRTGNRKSNEMIKDILNEKGINFTNLY